MHPTLAKHPLFVEDIEMMGAQYPHLRDTVSPECVVVSVSLLSAVRLLVELQQSLLPSGFPLTSASCRGGFQERQGWAEDWKDREQVWGFIFSGFFLRVHSKPFMPQCLPMLLLLLGLQVLVTAPLQDLWGQKSVMDDGPRVLLLALGPLPSLMASLHPTDIFVNSLSLNCPENIVT